MMIEASATVTAVQGDSVWLETQSRSACAQCAGGQCETSIIAGLFGTRRNRLQLPNSLGAQVGDRVLIGIPDGLLVRASLSVYGFPLAACVAFALGGHALGLGDGAQSLLALAGLAGGFYLLHGLMRASARRFQPELLRIERRQEIFLENVHFSGAQP